MVFVITGDPPNIPRRRRRQRTLYWLAADLAHKGLDMVLVSPDNVHYRDGNIQSLSGWEFEIRTKKWRKVHIGVRNPIWLDFMYLNDIKRYPISYRRLLEMVRRQEHPYANPPFPSKQFVYHVLLNDNDLRPACVPETMPVRTVDDIRTALFQRPVVWIKPLRGSGGKNIVRVSKVSGGKYRVSSHSLNGKRFTMLMREAKLRHFCRRILKQRSYLAQEELQLPKTEDGRRLDVRVTVSRDATGDWKETATTLRLGKIGSRVTNFHAGGHSISIRKKGEISRILKQVKLTLEDVHRCQQAAIRVAYALQKHSHHLAFLGIDVAPVGNCCYVYDCNTKPGRDILTNGEVRLMMRRLAGFCQYTSQRRHE